MNDAVLHVRGESRFVDDLPHPEGMLFAAVLGSPVAHGRVRRLDLKKARACAGVRGVFSAPDIPGENQIGTIVADEPLLAAEELHCVGQPVALVAADSEAEARAALSRIELISVLAGGCVLRQHVLAVQGSRAAWLYLAGFYAAVPLYYLLLARYLNWIYQ